VGETLGLIAGRGVFPLEVARCARRRGQRVVCVAMREMADAHLEELVDELHWIHPGEVGAGVAAFRAAGVEEAVMAGKVAKGSLIADPEALRLDGQAESLLAELPDFEDDSVLGKAADFLAALGIRLLPQHALCPELLAGEGVLTKAAPTAAQRADLDFGFPIARAIGGLDIGQTVVVKDRAVLAVEAIEGTDAAIRRGGALAAGACVVKVAKPDQDSRFDVPAIGPDTVRVLAEAGIAALGFEAGATLVLEREELVREADAHGIAVAGLSGPADGIATAGLSGPGGT